MLIRDYNGRKKRGWPPRPLPAPTPKKKTNLAHFPRKTKEDARTAKGKERGKKQLGFAVGVGYAYVTQG